MFFANKVPTENILHLEDTLPPTWVGILKFRGINTYLSSILCLAFFTWRQKQVNVPKMCVLIVIGLCFGIPGDGQVQKLGSPIYNIDKTLK